MSTNLKQQENEAKLLEVSLKAFTPFYFLISYEYR